MKRGEPAGLELGDLDIPLLRNLPVADQVELRGLIHRKKFPAHATLMTAEQAGEVVYLILTGTVKVYVGQEDGADVIIAMLGPGEVVGELSALGHPSRSASVVTLEPSTLLWIDRDKFQRCLMNMPLLAYNLACILAARLRLADQKIETLATQSVESRIARQILAFAEQYGERRADGGVYVAIRLTQGDLAAIIGASREHTNKVMVSYKERGYISVDRHYRITIHDQRALARRC